MAVLPRYHPAMAANLPARVTARPVTDRPVAGEIVTVLPAGLGVLPKRRGGRAIDRVAELTALIVNLVAEGSAIDSLAYRKSLEARAPASVKALANDLACYAAYCFRIRCPGLPASAARIVAYLEDCEARRLTPAKSFSVSYGSLVNMAAVAAWPAETTSSV